MHHLPKNNNKNKFLHKLQMLYFNRIDVSEGTIVNKASESKECDICYYWCFLDKVSTRCLQWVS